MPDAVTVASLYLPIPTRYYLWYEAVILRVYEASHDAKASIMKAQDPCFRSIYRFYDTIREYKSPTYY
jgi:hypothetical protein